MQLTRLRMAGCIRVITSTHSQCNDWGTKLENENGDDRQVMRKEGTLVDMGRGTQVRDHLSVSLHYFLNALPHRTVHSHVDAVTFSQRHVAQLRVNCDQRSLECTLNISNKEGQFAESQYLFS